MKSIAIVDRHGLPLAVTMHAAEPSSQRSRGTKIAKQVRPEQQESDMSWPVVDPTIPIIGRRPMALKRVPNGNPRSQRADHRSLNGRIAQPKVIVAQQWIGISRIVYEH